MIHLQRSLAAILCGASLTAFGAQPSPAECTVKPLPRVGGKGVNAHQLGDGSIMAFSGMNINIDGYGRAYHPQNRKAGAVLHLCVGGKVWLPDGSSYEGSESEATCAGKFMADVARIEAAGWADPTVGVVQWYGIAAEGSVKIAGRQVNGVRPLLQKDGSGFYVSPTSLVDKAVTDKADQRRYVNPLRVASAVVPASVVKSGIAFGSFGVAIHTKKQIAVPFVVGDGGPKIGEGSPALARQVSGLPVSDVIDLKSRYDGQVSRPDVLWVFFGGSAAPFDHQKEAEVASNAKAAFEAWGGAERLAKCLAEVPRS
ncbi:MAG: hypothetical protein U5L03_06170 [Burkholderiaceae bacterium]|nr:hypothetical protein [Burkholderiaceae bacterium]